MPDFIEITFKVTVDTNGGGEGSRTPVRKTDHSSFSECSLRIVLRSTWHLGALAEILLVRRPQTGCAGAISIDFAARPPRIGRWLAC